MSASYDDSPRLLDAVASAVANKKQLSIKGQGSKANYACSTSGDALQTSDHVGVVEYQPGELTISVRSGTPLKDVVAVLDERNQMLASDPPQLLGGGTIGGAVACGLNGPGRPWYGNLRDAVLGIEIVNGSGERLRFGGSVIKNVAGFDVSRLFVGSLGAFGLILTVNLRVQPKPAVERTIEMALAWDDAWSVSRDTLAKPLPITATCYYHDKLLLRMSGNGASVDYALRAFEPYREVGNETWHAIRDHASPFFRRSMNLGRAWFARGVQAPIVDAKDQLIEWAGAQVWCDADKLGNFSLGESACVEPFNRAHVTRSRESKYTERLRNAFDPNRVFNSDIRI